MPFNYIWGLLESNSSKVPSHEMFVSCEKGYKFYPFEHSGQIFTFDKRIWNHNDADDKATKGMQATVWPTPVQIEQFVLDSSNSFLCMIAFSDKKFAPTIEAGQTVELSDLPAKVKNFFLNAYADMGYDILDVSGISALTDIGYKAEEVKAFNGIEVNNYGLIASSAEAIKVATLASQFAPEHAFFFPVNVWGRVKAAG